MSELPFSIYKQAGRRYYQAAFKNETTGQYLTAISTKQETKAAAIKTAFQWLRDGIPRKGGTVPLKTYTLRDMARKSDVSAADCEFICRELRRRGLLKSYVMAETEAAVSFTDYLLNFWDFDNSPYVKEKLRKNHGIHRYYCKSQYLDIAAYWIPFFAGRLLGDISKKDINAFIETVGDKQISAARKNIIIRAGTIPLKWAYARELVDRDITKGIVWFAGKPKERQILSPEIAAAVFRVRWKDGRARLANMLAMVTGLRAGEIQALRVQDIGRDCLYIRHSWNGRDGLKTTKNNEPRTVNLPFPGMIAELLELAKQNPHGASMDSFVFWALKKKAKPIEERLLINGLREALVQTGMGKESAAVYTFHGWRHFYAAYMRERIDEKLLRSQTGHKTLAMLDHYSNHSKEGDRERIQAAQVAVFGGLLPESGADSRFYSEKNIEKYVSIT
jgi:integrase